MTRSLVLALLSVVSLAGCAAGGEDDANVASSQGDALTQSDASRALFAGRSASPIRRFHSDDPANCGASLELIHGDALDAGLATYSYQDCDDATSPPIVYHAKYDVVGGWLDGHLTDPTLRIDATMPGTDGQPAAGHVRWRYAIRSTGEGDAMAIKLQMFEDVGSFGIHVYGPLDIWLHPSP